jgi:hypothetical protein
MTSLARVGADQGDRRTRRSTSARQGVGTGLRGGHGDRTDRARPGRPANVSCSRRRPGLAPRGTPASRRRGRARRPPRRSGVLARSQRVLLANHVCRRPGEARRRGAHVVPLACEVRDRAHTRLPHSQLVTIDGGHFLWEERRDEYPAVRRCDPGEVAYRRSGVSQMVDHEVRGHSSEECRRRRSGSDASTAWPGTVAFDKVTPCGARRARNESCEGLMRSGTHGPRGRICQPPPGG